MSRVLMTCTWLMWLLTALMTTRPVHAELLLNDAPSLGLRAQMPVARPLTLAPYGADYRHAAFAQSDEKKQREFYPWRRTKPASPDYTGAARDTGYFMVYQLAVISILYVAPESVSNWTEEDKENYSWEKWKENVKNPHRDEDDFIINYVLHPYWGATYYIRGRERGFSRPQSFAFSFGLSFLFEYGFEAMFEKPSYQDLWVTPVIGSLIGEYWFSGVREKIRAKPGDLTWTDKTILLLTDPLGAASHLTDRALGIDTSVSLHAINAAAPIRLTSYTGHVNKLTPGGPPRRTEPAWGVQVQLKW